LADGSLARLFRRVLDALDYWPMQARLCAADAVCGPEPAAALSRLPAHLELGLSLAAKVLDLKGRFRCRGYGRKGRGVVSIKWAHGKD
jgi:hypothetical protein